MNKKTVSILLALLAIAWALPVPALENVTPIEAYELATTDPDAFILDVRTAEEWNWVGHPGKNKSGLGQDLEGKVFQVSWKIPYQDGTIDNPSFLNDVDELFERNPDLILILMCRSGVRGVWAGAVLEDAGYTVVNMVPGFEGNKGEFSGYRNVEGWKVEGLPYSYGGPGAYGD